MATEPQAQRWSRIRAERREQILAGAARTFAKHGVAKSSMELVAAESDATKVTVYAYFRSKDRLVVAVLQRWLAAVAEAVGSVGADVTDRHGVLMVLFASPRHGRIGSIRFSSEVVRRMKLRTCS